MEEIRETLTRSGEETLLKTEKICESQKEDKN